VNSLSSVDQLPRISKYEIAEELGHGGMATVYRARDLRLGRDVAVKVIHKHLRESKEVGMRFEAEARTVAKLRHPNIVEVYDVSADDEPEKYIVVELSRGMTLRRILATTGEMPPEVAAALALELAAALAHAHGAGVIHRDIKPENVLVETGEEVRIKLTDFGIAKILDAQGVTSTGQVLGSPAHMAPEQIEGGEVDARADVFGLGVLLYEAMVGHLPFEGKNPAQVLRNVLEGTYAAPDREKPAVGGRWARILARALAREADDRYPSAEAFIAAIDHELHGLGFANPRAELPVYFANPDAYRTAHAARIVPRLMERGEQARRAGDPHGAAADFNRALAYAPSDPALLKLISRLHRRRQFRRFIVILAASMAVISLLAAGAFGLRGRARARALPQIEAVPLSPPAAVSAAELSAVPEPKPSSTRAAVVLPKVPTSERPARHVEIAPVTREVSFLLVPKGALVSIDGAAPEELFMKTKRLSVGPHTFRAEAPAPSKCCEPLERGEEVKADEGTNVPQQVSLSLQFRKAMISAPEAPSGAQLHCPIPRIAGSASAVYQVHMSTLEQDISCEVDVPGLSTQRSSVTLRAGELTQVPWTAP
jgi:serine/threonine protein kinase